MWNDWEINNLHRNEYFVFQNICHPFSVSLPVTLSHTCTRVFLGVLIDRIDRVDVWLQRVLCVLLHSNPFGVRQTVYYLIAVDRVVSEIEKNWSTRANRPSRAHGARDVISGTCYRITVDGHVRIDGGQKSAATETGNLVMVTGIAVERNLFSPPPAIYHMDQLQHRQRTCLTVWLPLPCLTNHRTD